MNRFTIFSRGRRNKTEFDFLFPLGNKREPEADKQRELILNATFDEDYEVIKSYFKSIPSEYSTGNEKSISAVSSHKETKSLTPEIPFDIEKMSIVSSMLDGEDFEPGLVNNSERFFKKLFDDNREAALNGLMNLFYDGYSDNSRKIHRVVGILHLLSHFEYLDVKPTGQVIALAALNHSDKQVAEYAIKCFENWGDKDSVEKLRAVHFATPWLEEYAEEVIREIIEGD